MSDSTLSGRSAALRKLNRLTKTKLPKGHGELPENFKYVWLGLPDTAATTIIGPITQTSVADTENSTLLALYGMTYTSTDAGDRNILAIDIVKMVKALGNLAQLYSIYIGSCIRAVRTT